ncbi:MAG TPA: hypothetical protein VIJ20_11680, partial [Solirubrobacteraceae bacterium]
TRTPLDAPLDTRLELGPAFERVLYAHPQALVRGVAADGANGVNAEWERGEVPGFYIEEQRHGEEAVIAGVLRHDRAVWRLGLRELDWGFARQGPGGGFPATSDPFHSTSFFVEAVAELMLVLRGAGAGGIALPPHLLAHVDSYLPRLHAAARWMVGTAVWRAGLASDAPYTHRRFLVAAALGLTSVLTGDRLLLRRAREALELGIDAQLRDGVEPELGGYDSSYQARGMAYAEQYLAWLPRDPLAARLRATIARGLAWERTRIFPSGEVSIVANTRANGVMRDHNGIKRVVYPMVAQALLWWGLAAGIRPDAELAARVARWAERHPGQVGI